VDGQEIGSGCCLRCLLSKVSQHYLLGGGDGPKKSKQALRWIFRIIFAQVDVRVVDGMYQ
jgi:hypothetical protein